MSVCTMSSLGFTTISFSDSEKLVGVENYAIWAFLVEQILREQDLWYVVDPTSQTPYGGSGTAQQQSSGSSSSGGLTGDVQKQPTAATMSSTRAVNPDLQKHKELVYIIFTKTVSYSYFPIVTQLRVDPAKLWATLKRDYESLAFQRIFDLKRLLLQQKLHEGTSVEDYLLKVVRHVMELEGLAEEIPDKELIHIVLRSLPESWDDFISIWVLLYRENEDATFVDLEGSLIAEEIRLKSRARAKELSMVVAHQGRSDKQGSCRGRASRGRQGDGLTDL